MKRIWAALWILVMLVTLSGCGEKKEEIIFEPAISDGSWDRVIANGGINIGILSNALPLQGIDNTGSPTGFYVELANAICDNLGVKANFVFVELVDMVNELRSGNIDCIWDVSFIPKQNHEGLWLSTTYLNNEIVAICDIETEVVLLSDVLNYLTSVVDGSQAHAALLSEDIFDEENLIAYGTYFEALETLELGETHVFLSDEIETKYNVSLSTIANLVKICDVSSRVAFLEEDEDLINKFQGAMNTIISNYRASDISVHWFGSDKIRK